jgi:uncharacterized protein
MLRGEWFGRVVRGVVARPGVVLAVVGALAIVGAGLALRIEPSASTDTLVDKSSDSFQATEDYKKRFGDDAIVVLVKGNLQRTVLTSDLARLVSLEGCMSGNTPANALKTLPPVCSEFNRAKPARVVYGPGTFINTAAGQISDAFTAQAGAKAKQADEAAEAARKLSKRRGDDKATQDRLAREARQLVNAQFIRDSLQLALRYGLTSIPSLDNVGFVSQLVFDASKGVGTPKARFAYLFPSSNAALIQVRLRPELSEAQREHAIDMVREAVGEERFKLQRGGTYIVSGVPVVVDGLADAVQHSIFVLLAAALLVMAATLALVFRTRLRLLPLGVALGAAALTFGAVSLAGGSLTMASIAALPVLIGLAVDYAIQFQARFDEARALAKGEPAGDAAVAATVAGAPTIAAAGLATAVGFLVLLLSPVPMVRGFGAMLVLGIFLAFGCALTAGFAALVRFHDARRPADVQPALPRLRAFASRIRARLSGTWLARDLAAGGRWIAARGRRAGGWCAKQGGRAFAFSLARPRRVLGIALAVAVLGWAADTQTEVISDVRELVPRDLQALKDVNELQEATGVSGEIDVTVKADDLTKPAVIKWMTDFQSGVLKAHGYKPGSTCSQAKNPPELCPALSLPDLFRSGVQSQQAVRGLLAAVPPYFSQAVITRDRRVANLAFGIRLMPLDRQKAVIDDIERRLNPPPGVEAQVVGLPVLAAEANAALSSSVRRALTLLAALAAVFLVLLAVRRGARMAAVPLIPIALATGWSALVLFLLRIPLNPMSVTLGALVIAISTEFSVLLSARYQEERAAGAAPVRALELTYRSTGAAVLASGATAIAGFAALVASDIRMLRDFGIVTVVDLTVSLLGVMVVLPAALVWAEEHGPFRLSDLDPRRGLRALRRIRPPRPRLPRRKPEAGVAQARRS